MPPKPFSLQSLFNKLIHLLPWLLMIGLFFFNATFLYQSRQLGDFGSFIASGTAARTGLNPYGTYPLTSHAEYADSKAIFPNLNPPISVLLFEQLSTFDPFSTLQVWRVLSVLLYILALSTLYRVYKIKTIWLAWALTLAGFWDILVLGQIYIPLFAAAVGAWLYLLKDKPVQAGILIGIVCAFKPNMLVWPAFLFLANQHRAALWSVLSAGFLSILPTLKYGLGIYAAWLNAVTLTTWKAMPHYASLFNLSERLGVPWLGFPLVFLLLAWLAWWVWRTQPSALKASAPAIVTAYLVSLLASPRFALFLIPIFFAWPKGNHLKISAALLLIPTSLIIWLGFQTKSYAIASGMVYPLALLLLLWQTLKSSPSIEEYKL